MLSDLFFILYWWLILFGIGIIFLPLTNKLFSRFWDKGYLFSKVLGIAFISCTVWLLGSLKILPFFRETILLVIIGGLGLNLYLLKEAKGQGDKKTTAKLKIFVAQELLFFVCLAFWSFIRGFQPDIQGLEKFMDFGFVNSILRAEFLPPKDMWFAGGNINYYYFGHFITALLTKLSGLDSAITYNLMLATLFAFTFTLTFSLTSNLIAIRHTQNAKRKKTYHISHLPAGKADITYHSLLAGLLAALLLTLGANLHPAYYNLKMKVLKQPYCDEATTYWYPNATRYIGYCPAVEDKTIHEFPSYSFVVSDLHGHVSNIPFVITFLALVFWVIISHQGREIFTKNARKRLKSLQFWRKFLTTLPPPLFLLPLFLAIMYVTNQWDFPIYLTVFGTATFFLFYQKHCQFWPAAIQTAVLGIVCLLLTLPLIAPFFSNFQSLLKGIGFVQAHSLPHQLIILWGAPWFFGLTFVLFLGRDKIKNFLRKESFVQKFANFLDIKIKIKTPKILHTTNYTLHTDYFVLILLFVATTLVLLPEVIYVKDIYIPSYHRANTMFKLTYQSFIMYSIGIGYIFVRVLPSLKKGFLKLLLAVCYLLLATCLMVYPYFSINSYYGNLKTYRGLYGLEFLKHLYPDNYQAILWLNQNVAGQPVIVEAVGDSYTDYNQVSMATGLPTIEGWLVHEWLWRGSFDEPGQRASEVQQIYEGDTDTAKGLLEKYQVQYVIISNLEREKYPNINEGKFDSLGKPVFSSGNIKIFKVSL